MKRTKIEAGIYVYEHAMNLIRLERSKGQWKAYIMIFDKWTFLMNVPSLKTFESEFKSVFKDV